MLPAPNENTYHRSSSCSHGSQQSMPSNTGYTLTRDTLERIDKTNGSSLGKGLVEQKAGADTRNSSNPNGSDSCTSSKSPSITLNMKLHSWVHWVFGHDTVKTQGQQFRHTNGPLPWADRNPCLSYSRPPSCLLILDLEQLSLMPKS